MPLHTVSLGMIEPIRPRARHGQMRSVDGREEVLETKKAKEKKQEKRDSSAFHASAACEKAVSRF